MNTANLQLEGLCLAVAAITSVLRDKGVLSESEIERALEAVERGTRAQASNAALSAANVEAKAFPIRLLRIANQRHGQGLNFSELARLAGEAKDAGGAAGKPKGESGETLGVLAGVAPTEHGPLSSEEIGDIATAQEQERDA